MTRLNGIRATMVAGSVAAIAIACPSAAWAQAITSLDINASADYSTNPFLVSGDDTDSVSVSISAVPRVRIEDEVTRYQLAGLLQHVEYLNRYSSSQNASLQGTAWHRFDSRTELNVDAVLSSTLNNNSNNFGGLILLQPGEVPDPGVFPIIEDITLNGVRQRSNTARISADLTHKLSAFDNVSIGGGGGIVRYGNSGISQEFNYATASLGYNRTISERVSVGGAVSVLDTDYRNTRLGDGLVISPQLTLRAQLDARWSLTAAAGVSITKTSLLVGDDTRTAFSGSLGACRQGDRSNFCLFASRAATPTSFGGIQNQTSISASYSNRLTARDDLRLSATYAQVSAPTFGIGRSVKSVSSRASLDHRLSDRLMAFASAGYADNYETGFSRGANATISLGLSYRLGSRR